MIEYDDEQFHNITKMFKTLDIEDHCHKIAPYTNRTLIYNEYAPYDLVLEEECSMGINCIFKNTPLICPKNHQGLAPIKKYFNIPSLLCKYERPWKTLRDTNKPMKCNNVNCWFSHLKGRKEHLHNIWKELIESEIIK
jgi:hypothetical protein